ncbi:MAG: lipoprotein-releasing ABC transporter permease subunit [Thermodesulfobacteriota bacterium]
MGFFETFVAWRYLRGINKTKGFISLSTLISTVGVAVGVMALIVVIGVMTGYTQEMKKRLLGVNAHIVLLKGGAPFTDYEQVNQQVRTMPEVTTAHPFIYTQVMVSTAGGFSGGVLRGLDPATITAGGPRGLKLQQGHWRGLTAGAPEESPTIAIGNEMAQKLNLSVGSYLNILSPLGSRTATGRLPSMKSFRVGAIFHSGMYEFDSGLMFLSIPQMQKFLGLGHQVTGLEVQVANIYTADQVAKAMMQKLGPPFFARDWQQTHRPLFVALQMQKVVLFIILTLIILVAAFGIASTLFMMVMRKTKDIAILKTMGATNRSIIRIFLLNGSLIGLIGTSLGILSGLTLCQVLKNYQFVKIPKDIYLLDSLPVQLQIVDLCAIILAALAITVLASIYPSWQAARLDPVEAIRYE